MSAKKRAKKPVGNKKRWEELAAIFEAPGTEMLEGSQVLSEQENEELLIVARGKRKPISVRMPEDSLVALKEIAAKNNRKYQQLIVQAVDLFIARFQKKPAASRR